MNTWEWVLADLIAWCAAAAALGLWLGPVLSRWSQAREAVDLYKPMSARLNEPPLHWQ